jgi:hypothetical protein
MDHADVLDRLATAFVEPGKLASLEADTSADGQELLRHLETCETCRMELEAWHLTSMALAAATPDSLRAPADARGRVLANVAAMGVARGGAGTAVVVPPGAVATPPNAEPSTGVSPKEERSGAAPSTPVPPRLTALPGGSGGADPADRPDLARPGKAARPTGPRRAAAAADRVPFRWLALAAAVAVLLFVGGALLGPRLGFTPETPAEDLAQVVTAMDSIIQQPDHVAVALHTTTGTAGGSVLLDPATGNLAIVSTALVPTSPQTYDCFIVRGATKTKIGLMHFSDQTSYWVGKVATLANPGQPGDTFEVWLGGPAGTLSLSGNF